MWASCALGLEEQNSLVQDLFTDINIMNFGSTDSDLTFNQFEKLSDILIYLRRVSPMRDQEWIADELN